MKTRDKDLIWSELGVLTKQISEIHSLAYGLVMLLISKECFTREELNESWNNNKWAPALRHADLEEEAGHKEVAEMLRADIDKHRMLERTDFTKAD